MAKLRIVCLADTHNLHDRLDVPDGDVLIHAGDLTRRGTETEIRPAAAWLRALPHPCKLVIAGNHDFLFEREPLSARPLLAGLTYLEDSGITAAGLEVWGSPWQPWFYDWAFNLPRGPEIRAKWDLIPEHVDLLVTHGPPAGHGGMTARGEEAGCADLLDAVHRTRPRVHVFGHIHEGHGVTSDGDTLFVNASVCDVDYDPVQLPVVIEWDTATAAVRVLQPVGLPSLAPPDDASRTR